MAVITISRQFGAGGRSLGEMLAKKIGYRYVHEDIIKEIALKAEVSSEQVIAFEKRGTTKLMKFLDKIMSKSYIDRLTSENYGYVDETSYVDAVKSIIQGLYEEGNVVIVGRGGQFILKDKENICNILLVADDQYRTRFLMENYYLNESGAKKAIARADEIRNRFLSFYADKEAHNNPLSYNAVFNMGRMSIEKVDNLIAQLIVE